MGETLIHNVQDQKHRVDYLLSCTAQLQIASPCLCPSPICIGLEASGFNLKMLRDGHPGVCLPASFSRCPLLQNAALLPPLHVSCKPVAPATLPLPLCTRGFSPERRRMQRADHSGRKHCICLLRCQTTGYAAPPQLKPSSTALTSPGSLVPLNPEAWQLCHRWGHLKPLSVAPLSPAR